MARASVIVPSRAPAERLRRLLDSLAVQTCEHETIVIDNDSAGGVVSSVCGDYPFAEAIRLDHNAGFSMPMNLGVRRASGDVVVMLNDDCVCEPAFVQRMVEALEPGAGVVMSAGVMRDLGDSQLIDSAGMELDRTLLVYDYLNGEPMSVLAKQPRDPIGPSAKAAAFDRDAYLEVGGFDEHIFAYWEDVDLVLRLLAAGGRCRLAKEAIGTHEHSATLGSGSSAKNYLTGYGRGYLLHKWGVITPRRLPSVLAREFVIVAGQAVIDRTLSGVTGRVKGWRSTAQLEPFPEYAAAEGGGSSLVHNLSRRFNRRRYLSDR